MANLPTSPSEFFDDRLAKVLAASPDMARELNAVYCFKITGQDGGEWTVDTVIFPPTSTQGNTGMAQCVITVGRDDFQKLVADSNAYMQLYFQGKLQVAGDPNLGMRLMELFNLVRSQ